MKVWFGTTTSEFEVYKHIYYRIRDSILENDCVLPFDWLEDAENAFRYQQGRERGAKLIFEKVLKGMKESSIAIMEFTVPNFSSSHQINYCIFNKKPTLVLRQTKENRFFKDSYLEAVKSPYLFVENYHNVEELPRLVERFISKMRKDYKQNRYNVILDSENDKFLNWASAKYKKSRSEILRDALYEYELKFPDYQND